jgi:hypothetical protein
VVGQQVVDEFREVVDDGQIHHDVAEGGVRIGVVLEIFLGYGAYLSQRLMVHQEYNCQIINLQIYLVVFKE